MASWLSMSFEEMAHIAVSVVTVSLAFSLFRDGVFSPDYFWMVFLTVGLGFVLHELAHKYVAIYYGAKAIYQASTWGLLLALVLAFVTGGALVFAAPGAVYYQGPHLDREKVGKITLAGPMMNLLLALAFGTLAIAVPGLRELGMTGASINAFLGAFNMIPFGVLDGAKIYAWSKTVWLASFASFFAVLFTVWA